MTTTTTNAVPPSQKRKGERERGGKGDFLTLDRHHEQRLRDEAARDARFYLREARAMGPHFRFRAERMRDCAREIIWGAKVNRKLRSLSPSLPFPLSTSGVRS